MTETLDLVISSLFEGVIFAYYTYSLMETRKNRLSANVSIILGYLLIFAVSFYNKPKINVAAFFIINFAVIYISFNSTFKNAFIQSFILTSLMMLSEGILSLIMNIGIYDNARLDISVPLLIIHVVLSKLIYFVEIIITKHVSQYLSKKKTKYEDVEGYFILVLMPVFTIMSILGIISVIELMTERQRMFFALLSVFGVAVNIIAYWIYDKIVIYYKEMQLLREQQHKNALELTYCTMLEDKLEQTKIMRHDFKEHLKILEVYIKNDNPEAMEYLKSIEIKNDEINIVSYTDNKVLNILFSEKQKICAKKGIDFKIHASRVSFDFMRDIDIVSVFSNLLNNAIEGSEKSEKKIIYVSLYKMNDAFLVIKTENSCDKRPEEENGFYRSDKRGEHGVGLKSVARTVKEYNGDLRLEYDAEEKMFTATIMISLA